MTDPNTILAIILTSTIALLAILFVGWHIITERQHKRDMQRQRAEMLDYSDNNDFFNTENE